MPTHLEMNSEMQAGAAVLLGDKSRPSALIAPGLSGDYLELAHDLVGIGSYVLNLRTRILYISREMALLVGAGDSPMEMPIEEYRRRFYAPDNYTSTSTAADTAYDAHVPLRLDARVIRGDGRTIWVRTASMVRTNDVGDPVRVGMLRDITEQRESQDALERSEQQLRQQTESLRRMALVMEYANDAILMLTEDGHILEANQRTAAAYGYSLEELRQLTISDLRAPSTWEAIPEQLKAAGSAAGIVFETSHRRKDGSFFPVEVSSRQVEIQGNRFRFSVVRDISQRKEHEAQIARFNRLYAAVGQISHQAAAASSREGLLSAVCRLLVETCGFKLAWAGWVNPSTSQIEPIAKYGDSKDYLASIQVYADDSPDGRGPTGTAVREARTCVCNDFATDPRMAPWRERARPSEFRASIALPIYESGSVVGALTVYASAPNIFGEQEVALCNEAAEAVSLGLDKLENERRRTQAEARQALIVESSKDAIISKTLDGVITSWNRGAESLFGYTAEEAVGKSMLVIFPSNRAEEEADILRRIARGETVEYFETIRRRKSGEVVDVSVSIAPLRDGSGTIVGASKTARDISDRKRTDAINAARLHVIQYAATHSLDELLEETLNEAESLTGSQIGFYHFVDDDQQTLSLQNWSTRTKAEFCHAEGKGEHYPISQAGVWVECVAQRGPVIHNDYSSLANRKGMPEGHAKVIRELVVPVIRGGKIRAILGVGNKPTDYLDKDVEALSLLADLAWEIAERKRADELLRASETRFRTLIENAPVAVGLSRDGCTIYVNRRYRELFRIPDSVDVIGRSFLELWAPESRDMLERYSRLRAHGEAVPTEYEGTGLRFDGEPFPLHVAVATVQLAEGPAAVGFLVDLTEIRRAETALMQAEELYRGIFEGAAEGIFRTSANGKMLAANPTMARMFGYDSPAQLVAEVTDTNSSLWPSPSERQKLVEQLRAHGQVGSQECQLRRRDGKLIWTLVNARQVTGPDGEPLFYEGFISDITEKKQLEEQLLRVQRLESLGMLAAGIAHDLNNVLAPIRMVAPLLSETRTDPGDLEFLRILEASAERGSDLVRQILGFAKGVSGAPQIVQVKHLLRDVANMVAGTFPKSIVLNESLPKDLWPVMANATQLHQVLLNLCVNARDAMPQGGSLRLSATNQTVTPEMVAANDDLRAGRWLLLEIEDAGTGMTPEVFARMWEPFFTTKGTGKGTGLGLPTVRGIVEAHGGFMTVATELGRGTKFSVFLPAAESPVATTTEGAPVTMSKGAGERILFVDDEVMIRDMARPTLTNAGYLIETAENGERALEIFSSRPEAFALVATDIDMPIVDGPTLARRIKRMRPSMKILVASGLEDRGTDLNWKDFADDFIHKPFLPAQLVAAVRRLLSAAHNLTYPPR